MIRPTPSRSSGRYASPSESICFGLCGVTGRPSRVTFPEVGGVRPKHACAISERPAPTSPAMPTISPAWSENETLENTPSRPSPSTRRTSRPRVFALRSANSVSIGRPTIIRTISARLSSEAGRVATCRPSLRTVTASAMRSSSSSRCVISTTDVPRSRRVFTIRNSFSTSAGVSADVGSSRIRSRKSAVSARAISTN